MTSSKLGGAFAALSLALLAAPVFAQAPAPDAGPQRDHAQMRQMMEQHRAAMARDLHTLLRIRPDQEAAFAAFQTSMGPTQDGRMHPHEDWTAMQRMTTPQRLDHMMARMDEHMARMRQRIEATKAFYAALSPEQQQVFDAFGRLHGGRGGHRGWGGEGKGGWSGHGHGMGGAPPPPPPGA
jgi:protein CpxP